MIRFIERRELGGSGLEDVDSRKEVAVDRGWWPYSYRVIRKARKITTRAKKDGLEGLMVCVKTN